MPQEDSEVWDSHLRVVPSNVSPAIGLSLLCGNTHSQVLAFSGSLTQGHQSLQERAAGVSCWKWKQTKARVTQKWDLSGSGQSTKGVPHSRLLSTQFETGVLLAFLQP